MSNHAATVAGQGWPRCQLQGPLPAVLSSALFLPGLCD